MEIIVRARGLGYSISEVHISGILLRFKMQISGILPIADAHSVLTVSGSRLANFTSSDTLPAVLKAHKLDGHGILD